MHKSDKRRDRLMKKTKQNIEEQEALLEEYAEVIKRIDGFKPEEATREVLEFYSLMLKVK